MNGIGKRQGGHVPSGQAVRSGDVQYNCTVQYSSVLSKPETLSTATLYQTGDRMRPRKGRPPGEVGYWTWKIMPIQSASSRTAAVFTRRSGITEVAEQWFREENYASHSSAATAYTCIFVLRMKHRYRHPPQRFTTGLMCLTIPVSA